MEIFANTPDSDVCSMENLAPDSCFESGADLAQTQLSDDLVSPLNRWKLAQQDLIQALSIENYKVWIEPFTARAEGHNLVLECGDRFFCQFVTDKYLKLIQDCFQKHSLAAGQLEASVEIMATSKPNSTPNDSLVEEVPPAVIMNNHRQLARPPIGPLQVNPLFTFNHFVPGDDNIVPLEAAKTFVKGNLGFNVILFTGDVGSGKTHLTQAILQDYLINFPEKQAYYLFAENFANEMSACLKHHQMSDFVYKYRQACDILALEDFDFFCGKPAYEAEFIYTLEFLLNQGKKLVLTTRKSFQELNKLSPQLKSRVSASFPAQTNQPSYNDRIAILKYKAKLSNLNVSPTILEFLADRTNGDMRNLESLMMTILANSRFSKRPVTMDLAQKCLSFVQDTASNEQSTDRIIKLVCQNCHLGETDLASNSRERNIKDARAIAMYLVRNFTNLTYSNIGKVFNRKHSTTLHAIETIKNRLKNDPNLKAKLDYLTHQLINR